MATWPILLVFFNTPQDTWQCVWELSKLRLTKTSWTFSGNRSWNTVETSPKHLYYEVCGNSYLTLPVFSFAKISGWRSPSFCCAVKYFGYSKLSQGNVVWKMLIRNIWQDRESRYTAPSFLPSTKATRLFWVGEGLLLLPKTSTNTPLKLNMPLLAPEILPSQQEILLPTTILQRGVFVSSSNHFHILTWMSQEVCKWLVSGL